MIEIMPFIETLLIISAFAEGIILLFLLDSDRREFA